MTEERKTEERKANPVGMKESTYFWHLEEEAEREIAHRYVESMYPGSNAMVVSEIVINMLKPGDHVIVLGRDRKRAPNEKMTRLPTGERVSDRLDPNTPELLKSIKESPAIAVAPYIDGASRTRIGRLRQGEFFDKLGEYITGSMRGQDKEGTVRYIL